jgi:hypothetical protein
MAAGVKHYFKNGKEHKGATHKDAKGKVMSGARRTLPAANICFTRKICQLPLQRRRKGDGRTGRTGNY